MKQMDDFINNQTLTNLESMKNVGLSIKILTFGEWKPLDNFSLPLDGFHFVKLYKKEGNNLKLDALGIYKKVTG